MSICGTGWIGRSGKGRTDNLSSHLLGFAIGERGRETTGDDVNQDLDT